MDPLGADAGLMKPFTWQPPEGPGKLQPYYGVPELNSVTQGCELGGIPAPCSVVMSTGGANSFGFTFVGGPESTPGIDWHPDFLDWVRRQKRELTWNNYISLGREWSSELFGQERGAIGITRACDSVTEKDLNYDAWAGMQHITENHIDSNVLTQGKSKYKLNASTVSAQPTREAALKLFQNAVKGLNAYTFRLGTKTVDPKTGNIVISYGFPHTDDPAHNPSSMSNPSVEWWVGVVGIDDPRHPGMYTNVNTLILKPNCKDVVTSFPGTPEYFGDNDIRIGGSSQIFSKEP